MPTLLKSDQISHSGQSLATLLDSLIPTKASYSGAWAPTAVAPGAALTLEVSIPGAVPGDFTLASFTSLLGNGIIKAQVTAANTVTVTLHNLGSTSLSLSAGTLSLLLVGA